MLSSLYFLLIINVILLFRRHPIQQQQQNILVKNFVFSHGKNKRARNPAENTKPKANELKP